MIVQLPFLPCDEQARAVVCLLNGLPSYHTPGVQIYRGAQGYSKQFTDDEIAGCVERNIPQHFVKSLHANFAAEPDKRFNLAYPESEETVLANIRLAERIGARSVTIHPGTLYSIYRGSNGFFWRPEFDDFDTMRAEIREPLYERLKRLASETEILIGLENMPLPYMGDKVAKLSDILFEPNMVSQEDMYDFCDRTSDVKNLGITYDTAHAEISRKAMNCIKKSLSGNHFRGVYPKNCHPQVFVMLHLLRLLERKKVIDIQMSDTTGIWSEYTHDLCDEREEGSVREGLLPGDGTLGATASRIMDAISDKYQDVPISLDIEERDYIARPNQRKALARLPL
jgi:hypothetical protein